MINNLLFIIVLLLLNLMIFYLVIKTHLKKKNRVLHILHIGKTAGRALATSLNGHDNVKVMRHPIIAQDLKKCNNCDIAAVIRDPTDRLLSAIYWFKQGGESNEQEFNPCHKFVKDKTIDEIFSSPEELDKACSFFNNTAFQPTSRYISNNEGSIIPICFNKLEEDFNKIIKPYCNKQNCSLKTRNKSKRVKYEQLTDYQKKLVDNYVKLKYSQDVNYYNNVCK